MRRKKVKELMERIAKGMLLVGATVALALTGCGANQTVVAPNAVEEDIQVETKAQTSAETKVHSEELQEEAVAPAMHRIFTVGGRSVFRRQR